MNTCKSAFVLLLLAALCLPQNAFGNVGLPESADGAEAALAPSSDDEPVKAWATGETTDYSDFDDGENYTLSVYTDGMLTYIVKDPRDGDAIVAGMYEQSEYRYNMNAVIPPVISIYGRDYNVTSIRSSAFWENYCWGLTSITIPNSVTSIGYGAFSGCSGLTSITIPNSVSSIGIWAFEGCTSLTSINVDTDNPVYDSRNNCNAIIETATNTLLFGCKSSSIPNSITRIGSSAFEGCTSLSGIAIPNYVTSIGSDAFNGCSGLMSITIGNSVTSIGDRAFSGCSSLTDIDFGDSTPSIADGAFDNTAWYNNQPEGVVYAGLVAYKIKGTVPESVIIKNGTKIIQSYLFYGCKTLKSIIIPESATMIGDGAFSDCTNLTSITIPNSIISIGYRAFSGSGLTSVTIPSSVTTIHNEIFSNCESLTSVTIPNSVTSIGERAFEGCTGLTSVTIPNSVTSIGERAFEGCTGLTNVTIGNSVTSIGTAAFYYCSSLTSVTIPNSVTSIGTAAFYYCSSLTSVTIPESVTTIGNYAFSGCTGLTSVIIPNSVTSIGGSAFSDCSSLTSITIPNSVTSIGYYAFSGCSGLTSVIIPNSVTSIGGSAFSGCTSLTSVTIPNTVGYIGEGAFRDTPWLSNWYNNQPYGLVYLGLVAYMYKGTMPNNTQIAIKDGTRMIGDHAFSGCTSLTSITIPNSVTTIGKNAFINCTGLTSVIIPNSVTSIGDHAFNYCAFLTDIYALRNSPNDYNCSDYAFDYVPTSCILHVPVGCKDAYAACKPWNRFINIVDDIDLTGIENVIVDSETRRNIRITDYYNLQGQRMTESQRGVNIVRYSDGTTKKLLVK